MPSHRDQNTEDTDLDPRLLHAQKSAKLGLLAGSVAHDLNNSLMAVLANLDLARSDPRKIDAALEHALHATLSAIDLTGQMLSLASPTSAVATPSDLAWAVRTNTGILRASIPRHIDIDIRLPEGVLGVLANAEKIQQILVNLVVNASEAIGEKPGTIAISAGADERPSEPFPEGHVWMEVQDDGCGMDEATLERIFERFHTTKAGGIGLGMPAVRTIVRESGGDIEIHSRPGSGTCVRIRFSRTAAPIPKPRIARRKRTQRPEPRATTAKRILLVEDDPLVRQALAAIIGRSGHTQFVAHSGIEAVKFLQSDLGRFWGALVDLTLPGEIDGIGVMERIREVSKETFVVLMSGFDRSHVMDLVRAAPPDGFLQKPFGSDALLEEIRRLETLAKPPRPAADQFIPADAPPPADPIRPAP